MCKGENIGKLPKKEEINDIASWIRYDTERTGGFFLAWHLSTKRC